MQIGRANMERRERAKPMTRETLNWWDKPKLYEWDGTLILLRVQMWCDLCWAACMDAADQAEAVSGPAGEQRVRELQAEAAEWREAYRVVANVVNPRAKRA